MKTQNVLLESKRKVKIPFNSDFSEYYETSEMVLPVHSLSSASFICSSRILLQQDLIFLPHNSQSSHSVYAFGAEGVGFRLSA